jgi:hypothetical protein
LFASLAQLVAVKVDWRITVRAGIEQRTSMLNANGHESQPPFATKVRLFIFGKTRRAVLCSVKPPDSMVDAERHDPRGIP